MRKLIFSIILLFVFCILLVYFGFSRFGPKDTPPDAMNKGSVVPIDGVNWIQVLDWRFADGPYRGSWGWGDWNVVQGTLEGRDPKGELSVYFLPFHHSENFILETKVQFIQKMERRAVEAQLLTRDSKRLRCESGMVLFAEGNKVAVRHMAEGIDYLRKTLDVAMDITYGEWYVMRFMLHNGIVRAFVNDSQIYVSEDSFPVGEYREPHVAIGHGIARFEYVKIFVVN